VDTPFTTDGTALPAIPTPNAQTQIAEFRRVLASASADGLKSYDLSWLLHLVGDVHQPLHCATRVSTAEPGGDAGGNKVKLSCMGCGPELHAFWDDVLGTSKVLDKVIQFGKSLPPPPASFAAKVNENDWIAESFAAAKQTAYSGPVQAGDGPFSLTEAYKASAQAVAKERVALAGARLATLLNSELK
jgi:S1/P1 Nuclease